MDGIRTRMHFVVVIILVVVGLTSALDCHYCSGVGCLKSESWIVENNCPSASCYVLFNPKNESEIYARRCYARDDEKLAAGFMDINNSENAASPNSVAPKFEATVRVQEHPAAVVRAWICHTEFCNGGSIAEAREEAVKLRLSLPSSGSSAKLASSWTSALRAGFLGIIGMLVFLSSTRL